MELFVILLVGYVIGQCIYVYHTDAKLRAKCKEKSLNASLHILVVHVRNMHVQRYRNSKVEQVVDDITQEAREFRQEVQRETNDLADDLTQTARETAIKVKDSLYKDPYQPKSESKHHKKKK